MGTQLSHGKGHSSPHFSAHVYCGQTVAHLSYCWALASHIDVCVVRRTAALSAARLRRWSVADEMGCDACLSVDGGWSAWGPWSECSTTCGLDGLRRRERRCDNPLPQYDGRPCEGDTVETSTCPPTTECPGTIQIQIQIFIDTLAQKCLKATNMTHNKSIGTDTHTYTIRYDELYFRWPKSCRVASMICRTEPEQKRLKYKYTHL